jgi:hypothetical protein
MSDAEARALGIQQPHLHPLAPLGQRHERLAVQAHRRRRLGELHPPTRPQRVRDLRRGRRPDVPAGIDHQHPIRQIDPAPMQSVKAVAHLRAKRRAVEEHRRHRDQPFGRQPPRGRGDLLGEAHRTA